MKKIVSIHQPHFFPWLNYFNKIISSDIFIVLDDVQFRRRYFQNRAKIKANNQEQLLSIPLKKHARDTLIKDIEIQRGKEYDKILKTIESYYKKAPFFLEYYSDISQILQKEQTSLNQLNVDLLKYFLNVMDIKTEVYISSELNVDANEPNERLLKLCKRFDATHYIAGKGGKNYMDAELFSNEGIEILWQHYVNEDAQYSQLGKEFISGLSIADVLFNVGPVKAKELISMKWKN